VKPSDCVRCRLGLLAVAQGNGEVSIFSIPVPKEALLQRDRLSKGKRPAASESAADRLIELAPCASAQPVTLSGSLASCVEWLPSAPHDLLLVRGLLRALPVFWAEGARRSCSEWHAEEPACLRSIAAYSEDPPQL
jgi:hypothetical protein